MTSQFLILHLRMLMALLASSTLQPGHVFFFSQISHASAAVHSTGAMSEVLVIMSPSN